MSWLSDRLGTTGHTPSIIKNLGNAVAKTVVNAVPFGLGSTFDKVFNVTGTQSQPGQSVSSVANQTAGNITSQINAANKLGAAQSQAQGIMSALSTPMGLILVVVVLAVLFESRK